MMNVLRLRVSPRCFPFLGVLLALATACGDDAAGDGGGNQIAQAGSGGSTGTGKAGSGGQSGGAGGLGQSGAGGLGQSGAGGLGQGGTGSNVDAFAGIWSAGGKPPVLLEGVDSQLRFFSIPDSKSPGSWANAQSKGFVSVGSPWVKDITPDGTKWKGNVLWNTGTASQGITEVAWSPCVLTLNAAKTELVLVSESPFGGPDAEATLVKQ